MVGELILLLQLQLFNSIRCIADYTSGSDVYRAHIFTSSGTFDVVIGSLPAQVDYLVVGGGGGGSHAGAGGGAGGYRSSMPGSWWTITICRVKINCNNFTWTTIGAEKLWI